MRERGRVRGMGPIGAALGAALWLAASGWASAGKPPPGKRDRTIKPNGPELNGTRLDDDPKSLRAIEAIDLARGVTLPDGKIVRGLSLAGTAIGGKGAPASLVGAQLEGTTTDERPVRVRIDAAGPAPDPDPATPANEADGLTAYTVSAQLGAGDAKGKGKGGAWKGEGDFRVLCGGKPAIAIAGRWDYFSGRAGDGKRLSAGPTEITLSCLDAAIGKCVGWGYHPWEKPAKGRNPAALHEACVRAVRADYCGDGVSHTVPGQLVNIYDDAGIQKDTADWKPEAHWTPKGARCVEGTRMERMPGAAASETVRGYIERLCPSVLAAGCKERRAPGSDLVTERQ